MFLDLLAGARTTLSQVAHHLGISVEINLVLEVFLGQRDEPEAVGLQGGL